MKHMQKTRRILKKAYAFATLAAAFVATVAPGIVRAIDLTPQSISLFTNAVPSGTTLALTTTTKATLPQILFLRVTAYASTPDETDSTPFIMADGKHVYDGAAASNLFPFGTKIQIPSLFGNRIFTIEDRMAKRLTDVVDIWMATRGAALRFGVNYASIIVVSMPTGTNTIALRGF